MRTFSTKSAAAIAASGRKWISATSGIPQPALMSPDLMRSRLRASSAVGAVMRPISHPTSANRRIWATVAAVFMVSVVVIDWTRSGLSPPTATDPTWTTLVRRRR